VDQSVADLVARRTKAYLACQDYLVLPLLDVRRLTIEFPTQGSASALYLLAVHDLNAAAYDVNGSVYVNSEDGNLYVLNPHGKMERRIFLNRATDAAYTPVSLGPDGRIYALNDGVLFMLGK
jgi:hypothetical protein